MNDRNKHKVIGQINHQTADPKANASVFLFFPTAQNILKFIADSQTAHLVFADTKANAKKTKELFFANARTTEIKNKLYF